MTDTRQAILDIANAENTVDLEAILERFAEECGCELDTASTYEESLERFRDEAEQNHNTEQLCIVLEAAIERWHKLERSSAA